MKPREAVPTRSRAATIESSIASRLLLIVVPMAVVTVILGVLLVWALLAPEDLADLSWGTPIGIGVALLVAGVVTGTLMVSRSTGRSMSGRIGEVAASARRVAHKDLVELLDALRNPGPDLHAMAPLSLDTEADDEIGDLARSFTELHSSLIEVGARQMETLRAGVSSIFVTLARRNSSLVDRQLALLDQLESREEDPEVLGGFYQLDHLATRMRRNAESLLVLAGSESPRVWAKATDMNDVVRAGMSEIDDYQRIEVLALEPARLSGGAVSDVGHLVAELLDNAIQFSPPSEVIRVTGLFDLDGYQLSISDRGVGMTEARIAAMNRILQRPPALGLTVEPTLGLYVVAKLAHRHGLEVELIRGVPGITARITIPRDHLEVPGEPEARPWDAEHADRVAAERSKVAAAAQYPDIESREYVLKVRRDRDPSEEATDHVIDLTRPEYNEPLPVGSGLPVRTPGISFSDDEQTAASVTPGDGPSRIRSALAAYDRGRRSADDRQPGERSHPSDDFPTEEAP